MEEPKPPCSATQPPSVPNREAAASAEAPEPKNKRRKLEADEFRNSDFYKLRLLVKNLRPLFLEVFRTPDFRSSNVAHDIRNQMKTMLELTQKLRCDVASSEKCKKPSEVESTVKVKDEELLEKPQKDENLKAQPEAGDVPTAQPEKTTSVSGNLQETAPPEVITEFKEKAKHLDEAFQGTYVIGGSKFGWNFLVYPGREPVYYGITKESFLARRAAMS